MEKKKYQNFYLSTSLSGFYLKNIMDIYNLINVLNFPSRV